VLDTDDEGGFVAAADHPPGTQYPLTGRSVALFRQERTRR
jgi:hypothetical protein